VNRKSFLSVLFGSLAALFWGRKEKKPFDPKDLPWRRNSNPVPIVPAEIPTNEPLRTIGIANCRENESGQQSCSYDRVLIGCEWKNGEMKYRVDKFPC